MACILAYAAAETAINSIDRRVSMLALGVIRSASTSHLGGEDKSSSRCSNTRRFYSRQDSYPKIGYSILLQTKRSSPFPHSDSIVSPTAPPNTSPTSFSSSSVSTSIQSTAFSSMPSIASFQRRPFHTSAFSSTILEMTAASFQGRPFHTSASSSVIFKSSVEVDIPRTNFFDYVLGDISGAERKPAVTDGQTGRTIRYLVVLQSPC